FEEKPGRKDTFTPSVFDDFQVADDNALFDAGLITFDASGRMEISTHLDENQQATLLSAAPQTLSKTPSKALAEYLAAHRQHVFKKNDDLGRRGNG
ncbi:hypothetical protein SB861_46990, partial [Paraburkholderia sp. SIMBA_049]